MKIGLAQINNVLGDVNANLNLALEYIHQAKDQGIELLVFPELSLTGYDLGEQAADVAMALDEPPLAQLGEASNDLGLIVGFAEKNPQGQPYNAVVYFEAGEARHLQRKLYLPNYAVYREASYFSAGEQIDAFDTQFGRLAMVICADAWVPPVAFIAMMDDASLLIHLVNSPWKGLGDSLDIPACWQDINRVYAQLYGVYVIFVNRVGQEGDLRFWGGSEIVDPRGQVLLKAPQFEEGLYCHQIDLAMVAEQREAAPLMAQSRLKLLIREMQRLVNKTNHQRGGRS
jgi:predicted amidohydrolase